MESLVPMPLVKKNKGSSCYMLGSASAENVAIYMYIKERCVYRVVACNFTTVAMLIMPSNFNHIFWAAIAR